MRGNDAIPNNHFSKHWAPGPHRVGLVRTWFNQPARKVRRRNARAAKAAAVFPRPAAGALRPVVRGQTIKYNSKQRLGRGFTKEELREAGISAAMAPTIGIAVDARRRNRSLESLQANAARLKAYKANLVVFPRRAAKPKAFEASLKAAAAVPQAKGAVVMPLKAKKPSLEMVKITADMKAPYGKTSAYGKIRIERANARLVGIREKKAKEAASAKKDD